MANAIGVWHVLLRSEPLFLTSKTMPEYPTVDPQPSEEDDSEGLDLEQIRDTVGFVLRSARRRPRLAAITFVATAGLGLTVASIMPVTYSSQVKLLAQRPMHIMGGPQLDDKNVSANVSAMIMRRDKLVALVKDANLAETRPPALRLKDRIMTSLFGVTSDQDSQLNMVRTLEKKLEVVTDDVASTVVITVEWSDPKVAYDLVTRVQKNFLEARYDSDVEMAMESITVLEDHAKSERAKVDAELANYQTVVADWEAKHAPHSARSGPRPESAASPLARGTDPDLTKALEEKKLQIRAAEEAHQRGIESIRGQLVQAQLTLTPMHPTVVSLQQQLELMREPSAESLKLRNEESALIAQIASSSQSALSLTAPRARTSTPPIQAAPESSTEATPVLPADLDRDGQLQVAQSSLQAAIKGYGEALNHLDAAKVDLDIMHAAYKHQYTVVTPAELPREPKKSRTQLIGAASVAGGVFLAFLLAAAADLVGGVILESWQVRRKLRLEVLGELDRPA